MNDSEGNPPNDAQPPAKDRGDTRRQFVERLAKTAALPAVLPLVLSMSTAALAY